MKRLADLPGLQEFLEKTAIAVLALPIDEQGTIHAAAMNYWHDPHTLDMYFVTEKASRKCTLFQNGGVVQAACVIGTENGVPYAVQMHGTAQIVPKDAYQWVIDGYALKRGDSHNVENEKNVLLQFHPVLATYTDYSVDSPTYDWKPEPLELT